MKLSCCIWALSGPEDDILTSLAAAGFSWIDIRRFNLITESAQAKTRELELRVSCVDASNGLQVGATGFQPANSASRKTILGSAELRETLQ